MLKCILYGTDEPPAPPPAPAVYGLLGLRPIEQELDLRKLTLLRNTLYHKYTLEYEIAQRQMSVKDLESKNWFSECNRLLNKYGFPNIYSLDRQIVSVEACKTQLKNQLDSFIETEWIQNDKPPWGSWLLSH